MYHSIENTAVERRRQFGRTRVDPTHYFWDIATRYSVVSRVLSLRREGDKKLACGGRPAACGFQPILFEDGNEDLFSRAGIGSALQNHQQSRMHVRSNGFSRPVDVAQVGLAVLVEGSRHANDDRVHVRHLRVIGGSAEATLLCRLNVGGRDAVNVRTARVKSFYLFLVNVKARNRKFLLVEKQGQRQTNIAQTNDAHRGPACLNLLE